MNSNRSLSLLRVVENVASLSWTVFQSSFDQCTVTCFSYPRFATLMKPFILSWSGRYSGTRETSPDHTYSKGIKCNLCSIVWSKNEKLGITWKWNQGLWYELPVIRNFMLHFTEGYSMLRTQLMLSTLTIRGFTSGREGYLGSEQVFGLFHLINGIVHCMLINEWAWLRSRVCWLRLNVDLGWVLESKLR